MNLEYISYDDFKRKGYPQEKIKLFDCGYPNFNSFLNEKIDEWQEKLSGITYFLIDSDETNKEDIIVYAYATISTIGLLENRDNAYSYISGVEIRLFAIDKHFQHVRTDDGDKYSHIFFAILLQDLWSLATGKISFKSIFLQANTIGKTVYDDFGFIEFSKYIAPNIDDKIDVEECIPMICEITNEMMYTIFEY